LVLLLTLSWNGGRVKAQSVLDLEPFQESIQAQLEALNLADLLDYVHLLEGELQDYLPSLNFRELISRQEQRYSPQDLFSLLIRNLLRELYLSLHLLRQLIVIGS